MKWLNDECSNKFIIEDNDILNYEHPIRGIYGMFIKNINDKSEYCAYVRKSVNIYKRMFSSSEHITKLMFGEMPVQKINETFMNPELTINIRILERIPFRYEEYHKEVQELASAECRKIDEYQAQNQCLE